MLGSPRPNRSAAFKRPRTPVTAPGCSARPAFPAACAVPCGFAGSMLLLLTSPGLQSGVLDTIGFGKIWAGFHTSSLLYLLFRVRTWATKRTQNLSAIVYYLQPACVAARNTKVHAPVVLSIIGFHSGHRLCHLCRFPKQDSHACPNPGPSRIFMAGTAGNYPQDRAEHAASLSQITQW
jgi:hypothetical protein